MMSCLRHLKLIWREVGIYLGNFGLTFHQLIERFQTLENNRDLSLLVLTQLSDYPKRSNVWSQ